MKCTKQNHKVKKKCKIIYYGKPPLATPSQSRLWQHPVSSVGMLSNQKPSISPGVSDWLARVALVRGDWWSTLTAVFEYVVVSVTVGELCRWTDEFSLV